MSMGWRIVPDYLNESYFAVETDVDEEAFLKALAAKISELGSKYHPRQSVLRVRLIPDPESWEHTTKKKP